MIDNNIKDFLADFSHLVDEKKYDLFLEILNDNFSNDNIKIIISMLDKVNSPITETVRVKSFISATNKLLSALPDYQTWKQYYIGSSYNEYPIDKNDNLSISILFQGYNSSTYGFNEYEIYKIIRNHRSEFHYYDGTLLP